MGNSLANLLNDFIIDPPVNYVASITDQEKTDIAALFALGGALVNIGIVGARIFLDVELGGIYEGFIPVEFQYLLSFIPISALIVMLDGILYLSQHFSFCEMAVNIVGTAEEYIWAIVPIIGPELGKINKRYSVWMLENLFGCRIKDNKWIIENVKGVRIKKHCPDTDSFEPDVARCSYFCPNGYQLDGVIEKSCVPIKPGSVVSATHLSSSLLQACSIDNPQNCVRNYVDMDSDETYKTYDVWFNDKSDCGPGYDTKKTNTGIKCVKNFDFSSNYGWYDTYFKERDYRYYKNYKLKTLTLAKPKEDWTEIQRKTFDSDYEEFSKTYKEPYNPTSQKERQTAFYYQEMKKHPEIFGKNSNIFIYKTELENYVKEEDEKKQKHWGGEGHWN